MKKTSCQNKEMKFDKKMNKNNKTRRESKR